MRLQPTRFPPGFTYPAPSAYPWISPGRVELPRALPTPVEEQAVVALYDAHKPTADAVRELERRGFDLGRLSIVGRDFETESEPFDDGRVDRRAKAWDRRRAFWAGMWQRLNGSAMFMIPGLGPLLAAGPVVGWVGAALERGAPAGGMTALGAGLRDIGIRGESVVHYEARLRAGNYVVVAQGSPARASLTGGALARTAHDGVDVHDGSAVILSVNPRERPGGRPAALRSSGPMAGQEGTVHDIDRNLPADPDPHDDRVGGRVDRHRSAPPGQRADAGRADPRQP